MKKIPNSIKTSHTILTKIPTVRFSKWLKEFSEGQTAQKGSSVPCGDCRGCCTSGYFIHIHPDEKTTLAAIPKKLLFPAPGLPKGHVLLGYKENGHCPMFVDNQCSIYGVRPQTCRNYDCRIFAATGIKIEKDKPRIAEQIKRWQFDVTTKKESELLELVRASGKRLRREVNQNHKMALPLNATQVALLALKDSGKFN